MAPGQADLVAVEEAWSAGQGHLDQGREPDRRTVHAHHGDEAWRVVAVEQVQLHGGEPGRVRRHDDLELAGEPGSVDGVDVTTQLDGLGHERHVQARAAGEGEDRFGEGIVHQGVEAVTRQPLGRRLPDFADEIRLGVDFAAAPPELLPEPGLSDLLRDIEAPAVDAEPQPALSHSEDVLPDGGIGVVELGQRGQIPPGLISEHALGDGSERLAPVAGIRGHGLVDGSLVGDGVHFVAARIGLQTPPARKDVRVEQEPVPIWRRGAVLEDVVERPETTTGVIEHAVEDDPHSACVGFVDELSQSRVAAQERIDHLVVVGVVAMVRCRSEDRSQVQRRYAEAREVVEVFNDTEQVAALEAVMGGRRVPGLERARLGHSSAGGETVRKDLVEDGVPDPIRRIVKVRGGRGGVRLRPAAVGSGSAQG